MLLTRHAAPDAAVAVIDCMPRLCHAFAELRPAVIALLSGLHCARVGRCVRVSDSVPWV